MANIDQITRNDSGLSLNVINQNNNTISSININSDVISNANAINPTLIQANTIKNISNNLMVDGDDDIWDQLNNNNMSLIREDTTGQSTKFVNSNASAISTDNESETTSKINSTIINTINRNTNDNSVLNINSVAQNNSITTDGKYILNL